MKSQERMKHYADKGRSDGEFIVGDLVYLKLQPADFSGQQKAPQTKRYYGPFEITEKTGTLAYRLKLPEGSLIHPVFHVSPLKKKVGWGDET